jgi:NAD(P)-dependent dehydrogenase (short-subunit alcohol dehydrogenase family)
MGHDRSSVLITGCSSGFGLGLAVELSRRGWRVVPTMRDPAKRAGLDAAWADAELTGSPDVVTLDVRSPESVSEAAAGVTKQLGGPPDALVLNAGYTTVGFFEDITAEQVRDVVETNLLGAMEVTRAFLPAMRRRGSGRILVMSSNAANVPHPMFAPYAAAKWGLEGWAEALAMELVPFGVEVMIAQPGAHGTQFSDNLRPALPPDSAYAGVFAAASGSLDWLGRHQRDAGRAVRAIADVLESPRPPFRARVGPDAVACAVAAHLLPYRLRSGILARFLRFPTRPRPGWNAQSGQLRDNSVGQAHPGYRQA